MDNSDKQNSQLLQNLYKVREQGTEQPIHGRSLMLVTWSCGGSTRMGNSERGKLTQFLHAYVKNGLSKIVILEKEKAARRKRYLLIHILTLQNMLKIYN